MNKLFKHTRDYAPRGHETPDALRPPPQSGKHDVPTQSVGTSRKYKEIVNTYLNRNKNPE